MNKFLRKELILEILAFLLLVFFVAFFYENNILTTILLALLYLTANRLWHKKHDFIFFVVGAIAGTIGEIIEVNFYVWRYTNPDFLGVPMWIPFAWGFAGLLIVRIAETFFKIEKRS